ncbi:MAG: FAD-dependent monooxygenase [Singulisphaera sp.]
MTIPLRPDGLEQSPPRTLIVGGSLGGLMTGLELRDAGCEVTVFERSDRVLDDRGAGIVMQPETLHLLRKYGLADERSAGVWSNHRQYLDRRGGPASAMPSAQLMTSWGLLYRHFRSAFPDECYRRMRGLGDRAGRGRRPHLLRGRARGGDLLVGADGARSSCRRQLMPEVQPRYAGYVAWRGVVGEAEAEPDLLRVFADHFTFFQMERSHVLCYLIPGANGELEPGQRRLNWVWYWNVPEAELAELLTGTDGRPRDFSVPPGQVRPEYVAAQMQMRVSTSPRRSPGSSRRRGSRSSSPSSTWRCRAWS